jgi:NAD(P)-dependent dehydrogenase (short-subunit alcohol dehydrogenase family)
MKTIVMTGGTSGFGAVAALQILAAADTRLLLGARRPGAEGIETLPLDRASLASVRLFADALLTKLGDTAIDSLVLNAGVQLPTDSRTEDGFETTFATNQLAHYLLLRILLPKLAHGATVVITTSDTHVAIKKLDPEGWAHQQHHGFLAGMRAYASSKLCNLLTARALTMSETGKRLGLVVTAYTPGFTPDTTLFRHWPRFLQPLQAVVKLVAPVVRLSSAKQAGGTLADLALGRTTPPAGRIYAALAKRRLTWPDPSELARSDAAAKELWRASARMVGVSEDPANIAA